MITNDGIRSILFSSACPGAVIEAGLRVTAIHGALRSLAIATTFARNLTQIGATAPCAVIPFASTVQVILEEAFAPFTALRLATFSATTTTALFGLRGVTTALIGFRVAGPGNDGAIAAHFVHGN